MNISMQRAVAKSRQIKLGKSQAKRLNNFKVNQIEKIQDIATQKYNSQDPFGGARTKEEIDERNKLMAGIEFNKLLNTKLEGKVMKKRLDL